MKVNFLLVHIAKTGGASIRRMLNRFEVDYECLHNNKIVSTQTFISGEYDYDEADFIAYFVRNPYDRLQSCYSYFHAGGLNQYDSATAYEGDRALQSRLQKQFPDFKTCCENLQDFCQLVPHAKPMSAFVPESLLSASGKGRVFQGRYESFEQDVTELFSNLGIDLKKGDFEFVNPSTSKTSFPYDSDMKRYVRSFYADDFELFSY